MTLLENLKRVQQWTVDDPDDPSDPNVHTLRDWEFGRHADELIRIVDAAKTASDHWHDATVNETTIGTDMAILKQLVAPFFAEEAGQ